MWSKAINSWKTCVDKISFRALIPISHLDAKQRVSQNSGDAGACCFGMFYDGNLDGTLVWQWQWYDTIHSVASGGMSSWYGRMV